MRAHDNDLNLKESFYNCSAHQKLCLRFHRCAVCLMLADGYTIVCMIVICRFSLQIAAHIARHSCTNDDGLQCFGLILGLFYEDIGLYL